MATLITADAQFAPDSSLEGAGFELPVPRRRLEAEPLRIAPSGLLSCEGRDGHRHAARIFEQGGTLQRRNGVASPVKRLKPGAALAKRLNALGNFLAERRVD
jgi:hypothetical protein